jgi:hypothetical protein
MLHCALARALTSHVLHPATFAPRESTPNELLFEMGPEKDRYEEGKSRNRSTIPASHTSLSHARSHPACAPSKQLKMAVPLSFAKDGDGIGRPGARRRKHFVAANWHIT